MPPPTLAAPAAVQDTTALAKRLQAVRRQSLALAAPLSAEDCQAQSMPDASPVKWHLAHTTWFFETFVLEAFEPGFQPVDPAYRALFNSCYQGVGPQHPRPARVLITRPGLAQVLAYRAEVDARLAALLVQQGDARLQALVTLGLQHEQQHQELMLTDLKHLLWQTRCGRPTAAAGRWRPSSRRRWRGWRLTAAGPMSATSLDMMVAV